MNDQRSRSYRIWSGVVGFGAYGLLLAIDFLTESETRSVGEVLGDAFELALIVASATGVALLSGSVRLVHEERRLLTEDLRLARAEGEAWRQRAQVHLQGLGEEIAAQFETWQLTTAEREVALLMLKGFSHGEIAGLRGTTEATIRHQARAVYRKSGMPGRSALCAYFLEDLLPAAGNGRHSRPLPGGASAGLGEPDRPIGRVGRPIGSEDESLTAPRMQHESARR
ncbi:MAG: response regulator transcription factor [Rhodocyclaceae bacterium]|nr:response regulator transcription factor [Rhodocyclaceae bacterium]